MKTFKKDPDGKLDYAWDWTDWLDGDTISSFDFDLPADFTLVDSYEVGGVVTAWLSGGLENKTYTVTCSIVTALGREDDRSAIFNLEER